MSESPRTMIDGDAPEERDRAPDVSVVVPTYNRPAQLQSCLGSLAASEYPRNRFEVIVVDDGGQTDLEAVVGRFRSSMNVSLMRIEHAGPAAARNAGARRARGEYLVFTDDDCVPSPEWLGALAAGMSRWPHHMIAGTRLNAFPENQYLGRLALRGRLCAAASEQRVRGLLYVEQSRRAQKALSRDQRLRYDVLPGRRRRPRVVRSMVSGREQNQPGVLRDRLARPLAHAE